MSADTKIENRAVAGGEMDLVGAPCFIERQFPVAKVSMESYKERKAVASQTLTGLGKWWGRKPLVLVRAAILGALLPTTQDAKRDHEIFLKLMTMDNVGMLRRKKDNIDKAMMCEFATADELRKFSATEDGAWRTDAQIAWAVAGLQQRNSLFCEEPTDQMDNIAEGPRKADTNDRKRAVRTLANEAKAQLDGLIFGRLPYSRKLSLCSRPEDIDGPEAHEWEEINQHLGTNAKSLDELVQQLGIRRLTLRFGHRGSMKW